MLAKDPKYTKNENGECRNLMELEWDHRYYSEFDTVAEVVVLLLLLLAFLSRVIPYHAMRVPVIHDPFATILILSL
jgi:hypothetical protein